ncbi:MAG: hypothetical protein C4343_03285, partial [Chloroflexota bacterium]
MVPTSTTLTPPQSAGAADLAPARAARLARLPELVARRILVLDGAMGTMLQAHRLGEADVRGERFVDHPRDLAGALLGVPGGGEHGGAHAHGDGEDRRHDERR